MAYDGSGQCRTHARRIQTHSQIHLACKHAHTRTNIHAHTYTKHTHDVHISIHNTHIQTCKHAHTRRAGRKSHEQFRDPPPRQGPLGHPDGELMNYDMTNRIVVKQRQG